MTPDLYFLGYLAVGAFVGFFAGMLGIARPGGQGEHLLARGLGQAHDLGFGESRVDGRHAHHHRLVGRQRAGLVGADHRRAAERLDGGQLAHDGVAPGHAVHAERKRYAVQVHADLYPARLAVLRSQRSGAAASSDLALLQRLVDNGLRAQLRQSLSDVVKIAVDRSSEFVKSAQTELEKAGAGGGELLQRLSSIPLKFDEQGE